MEQVVLAVYQKLAQAIANNIEEDWARAYMLIRKQGRQISHLGSGTYADDSAYLKPFLIRNEETVFELADSLDDLHAVTTAGGHTRWNFLWFALLPSGAYEVEFIWNQDEEDRLTHLGQTKGYRPAARSADLRNFKLAQAERRSPLVYECLVRAAIQLIPEAWVTASVSLREVGIGIMEHHAAYRSQPDTEEEEMYITHSWPALLATEELALLKKSSGHPDWQQVTFKMEAGGTYRAMFTTEDTPASGYTYEGQWLAATGAEENV